MDEIKINNTEKSAVDGKWKNPGASLYNELYDASNWKELIEEAYLIAPINDIHNDPRMKTPYSRSGCKYPHHVVKDGKLILSKSGVRAAYARLKQMGKYSGNAKEHIEKHLKELGMMDKDGVHYEDTIQQNFFQIEMYLQEKTKYPFIEDFMMNEYSIRKLSNEYQLISNNGELLSHLKYWIYDDIPNFDWINITDVDTNNKYLHRGYATALLHELVRDMHAQHPEMGLYLLVRSENTIAINLYKKCGFKNLKTQTSANGNFYVMYLGDADINQLKNTNFKTGSADYLDEGHTSSALHNKLYFVSSKKMSIFKESIQESMEWINQFTASEEFRENAAALTNIRSPQSLSKWMRGIKPGYAAKRDNFYHDIDDNNFDPDDQSSLQPPKDIARSKKGSVYDKVELERYWFDSHGYDYAVLCLIIEKDVNDFIIHPFIVYQQGKAIYWFENSLPGIDGSMQFKRLDDLVKCVIKYVRKANDTSSKRTAMYYLNEPPKYGINKREYLRYVQTQIELPLDDLPVKLFDESTIIERGMNPEMTNNDTFFEVNFGYLHEDENTTEDTQEESMPKQADKKESDKNGVNRKKLYIAFIEWSKTFSDKNAFGSMFDKDAFHVTYPFVPEAMRYFYRIANPLMCILSGNLTFFQLSELRKINAKNSQLSNMMIFAATENDMRVFNVKDGAVYMATEENGAIKLGVKLADSFDLYIQTMIDRGDILNGDDPNKVPDVPPEIPDEEDNTSEDNNEEDIMDEPVEDTKEDNPESSDEPPTLEDNEETK